MIPKRHLPTWITTIVPTAVAACAARGEGGSPTGLSLHKAIKLYFEEKFRKAENRDSGFAESIARESIYQKFYIIC